MQLLLPIRSLEQAVNYLNYGIKEFYCGYITPEWITYFNKQHEKSFATLQISLNRRDYLTSNITNHSELESICKVCRERNAKIFITLNAAFYSEVAYPLIEKWLCEIEAIGIKHIIISDIGIMNYVFRNHSNLKITVSCENQVINEMAVKFYMQFHPERIVFPRHMAVKEIENIIASHPEVEFESFLISSRCVYDDGNCRCIHDIEPICSEAWITKFFRIDGKNQNTQENRLLKTACQDMTDFIFGIEQSSDFGFGYGKILCSLCSVYNLSKYSNFSSLKVVGRGMKISDKEIKTIQKVVELSTKSSQLNNYMNLAKEFLGYPDLCENGIFCCMRGMYNEEK